ncbi:MAG TPA: class I SAM-dependent methyltransferase [Burkholderiales bacterium]|nr:class I SAM-dependent methyltransferase [Burkholderiales bacterium]
MPAILTARARRAQFPSRLAGLIFVFCAALAAPVHAQERFSLFVATEQEDVPRMLKLAGLKSGDMVYDLGSGDGRIVLEAAKINPTARGRGIEIDEKLVMESRQAAAKMGLEKRVQFLHQNAFDADLKEADIIAMWLWPELMRMLRPKILAEARPGTRIVTRTWDMGPAWKPDAVETEGAHLFLWIVPAKVAGNWTWTLDFGKAKRSYAAIFEQQFQNVEGVVRSSNRRGVFDAVKLTGDEITFSLMITLEGVGLARHQFSGRVNGDVIEGTVRILHEPHETTLELPWRAQRTPTSTYFAPTGVSLK